MKQAYKAALTDRLNNVGLVSPTLAEAQAEDTAQETVRSPDVIYAEINLHSGMFLSSALAIGKLLVELKKILPHGTFISEVKKHTPWSRSYANNFMRLYREYGTSSNVHTYGHLNYSKALALLALPESEREEFLSETHQVNGEEKTVVDMTSRELEKAIKERDELRKEAEQAKADAKAAAEARASMEESLKTANELLDRAMTDKKLADGAVTALEEQLAELKAAPVDVAVMQVDQEALDKARAEGEAAKAAEVDKLQAKLDKAQEDKKKADEKRKNAEASVDILKLQLAESTKAKEQAAAMADPDAAKFEVYFNQAQEVINKLGGLLLRARRRGDQGNTEKMTKTLLALSDAIKGAVQ